MTVQLIDAPAVKVKLLAVTKDPAAVLGTVVRGYKNEADSYTVNITGAEVVDMLEQIQKTKLQTPLEFVHTVFLLNDVTRSFTHQLVRTRVGVSFVQESLRFSEQRDAKILLRPNIAASPAKRIEFTAAVEHAVVAYNALLKMGVPIEDARGVLPHDVLTNIFVGMNLSALAHLYENRMCCQAQGLEWQEMLTQLKGQMPQVLRQFLKAPWDSGAVTCGFGASFDRPCLRQSFFDDNLRAEVERRGKKEEGSQQ